MRRSLRTTASCASLAGVLLLGGCAVPPPSGPTVMALPGAGKPLTQFQQDDYACRMYAQQAVGPVSPQGQVNSQVGTAAIGTLGGAALGAAIGAIAGNAGAGTAIGATTGLVGGSAVAAGNTQAGAASMQQRYNVAYTQCMYSRGNSVQAPPPPYYGAYPAYPYPAYAGPDVSVGFGFVGGGGHWH
jgi:hypothetical protein